MPLSEFETLAAEIIRASDPAASLQMEYENDRASLARMIRERLPRLIHATLDDDTADRIGKAIAEDFKLQRPLGMPHHWKTCAAHFTNKGIARHAARYIADEKKGGA